MIGLVNMYKYKDIAKIGSLIYDDNAIRDSIKNILETRVGELPFNRSYGSHLEDYLFYNMSFSVTRLIRSDIINSITRCDPRVKISNRTEVKMDEVNRTFHIDIYFTIVGREDLQNFKYIVQGKK